MDKAQFGHVSSHMQEKIAIEEECFKQLHIIKGRKTTNLMRTKYRFNFGSKINC